MPYISPAISPTRPFSSASPPGSAGPSSPDGSLTSGSPRSSPTTSRETSSSSIAATHAAHTSAITHRHGARNGGGSGAPVKSTFANGFQRPLQVNASSDGNYMTVTRPGTRRHHSRSHSSDALLSMGGGRSSDPSSPTPYAKQTPGYIFVHPTLPRTGDDSDEHGNDNDDDHQMSYSYSTSPSSSPSSKYRPAVRHTFANRHPSPSSSSSSSSFSSSLIRSLNTIGDDGDVAPPRTSRSARSKAVRYSSGSVSADSSPRGSISGASPAPYPPEGGQALNPPPSELEGLLAASVLPLPSAFAKRSSSSPSLIGLGLEHTERERRLRLSDLPLPSLAPSHSLRSPNGSSRVSRERWEDSIEEQEEEHDQGEGDATPRGEYYLHDHPGHGTQEHHLKSTDLALNDSALANSWESTSSTSNSDTGSDTERLQFSSSGSERETHLATTRSSVGRHSKASSWGDVPVPPMDSPASFSFASSSSVRNGNGSERASGSGSGRDDNAPDRGKRSSSPSPINDKCEANASPAAPSVTLSSVGSSQPPSGPLAPAAAPDAKVRRPKHVKVISGRANSTPQPHSFRLESFPSSSLSVSSTAHGMGGYSFGGHQHHLHHGHSVFQSGIAGDRSRPPPLPTPMLRKKSGELVKSSMKHDSGAKSAPTTPTGPKAVHFDEQLERVKLFLAQQRPLAVSRDGSPIETETEDDSEAAFPFPPMTTSIPAQITLVLPDFANNQLLELGSRDVCFESLEIAADSKSLKGSALLRNVAFEKRLSVRFTFDDWQTVSEVTGEWVSTLVGGTIDRWTFSIKLQDMLARIEDKTMFIALRYTVDGRDIWDNNDGQNYRAEFRRQAAKSQAVVGGSRAARHEWAVTNSGQASERMNDLRRELDRLVAEQDDFGSGDEIILSRGFRRYIGGEEVMSIAQVPAAPTFASRYDFGASLKNAGVGRNSPQTSHAILDNPYFAAPNAAASDATINSWRSATGISPSFASPAKPQHQPLYADGPEGPPTMTTAVIGGMPATTFVDPSAAVTPPASFSGSAYYQSTESNGVISTDYGLPNYMSFLPALHAPPSPPQESTLFLRGDKGEGDLGAPGGDLVGGEPLARQGRFNSFPPTRLPGRHSTTDLTSMLEPSLEDKDLLDPSLYAPARSLSPAVMSPANSPPRQGSPPPRPSSPGDLLSPSPSSTSTDTSISTPQSPNGSPPLRLFPYIASGGRPDMGSDTYFNFVHRYCWGNGDTPSQVSPSSSGTSTALGLAGLNAYDVATPRGPTPPSSCSASLLSSPTGSSGSRTPSPIHGSPTLETVSRMDKTGYLHGPPTVQT